MFGFLNGSKPYKSSKQSNESKMNAVYRGSFLSSIAVSIWGTNLICYVIYEVRTRQLQDIQELQPLRKTSKIFYILLNNRLMKHREEAEITECPRHVHVL